MPMPSQDPLPQATDFLSLCESCHKMVGQLWLVGGQYICDECHEKHKPVVKLYNYKKVEFNYTPAKVHVYGKRWTKWCGANNDLSVATPDWCCQSCGEKQANELPSYLIRINDGEFARICSVCLHVALERHINNIFDLLTTQRTLQEFC